ncbi:PAS domain-containing protein [Bacteroidota bacterium]
MLWLISGRISQHLSSTSKLFKALALGDISTTYKLSVDTNDEIGDISQSLNSLIDGLNKTSNFAAEIGKGKLEVEYDKLSDKDVLGASLINMRESLIEAKKEEEKRKIEDKKQNWSTEGIAKFGDILRQSTNDLEEFGYNIISNLVKYIDANQGGIFIINEDENNEKTIDLVACYAFDKKKYLEKKIKYGEGLIGRCVLEAESIHMTEIPDDYISITSGLGKENPRSLLIVPLLLNDEVYGVIELASFKGFEDYKVSFVEKIGESIASTISSVKINLRTAKLLEESKHQAEELASQEEEMRQNLEELQATQEESARKEAEMSGILAALNASMLVAEFDVDGNIISANDSFANTYGIPKDQIVNRLFKDVAVGSGIEADTISKIWNTVKNDEIVKNVLKLTIDSKEVWLNQTFAPILNNDGNAYKILNIAIDVTETKKQELQVEKLLEESQKKNDELQQLKEEDARKSKEMLDTIEAHQKTLTDILDQIPGKVFLKDKDGKMVLMNTTVLEAHNCKAEDLIGKSDLDFFADDPELAQKLWNEEQDIIKSGKAKHFEQKEFVNNTDQYLKTVKMPFYIHYMDQTGLLGIQFDITDVKEMQVEIKKQNEELLEAQHEIQKEKTLMDCMMDNIPDNIYFKDVDSKFLRISTNMLSLFNATSFDQVKGKSDFDFFSSEHAQQAFDDEQNIMKTRKPIIGLIEKETFDDGTENWVDTTKMPLLDREGNVIGTFGISRNVTQIKKMEIQAHDQARKLEQSEEELKQNIEELQATQDELIQKQNLLMWESSMFNTLMNNLPDRISFKDLEGKFRRVNKAKSKKHNINDPMDIIGKSDYDFFTKEHADKAYKEELELIKRGKPMLNIEEKLIWKDGSITWGSTSRMPFANDKGEKIGTFVMTKDITDIKLAKAQLENKNVIIKGVSANTPILVYKVDAKGIINEISGLGLKLMNTDEKTIIGKQISSVFAEVRGKLDNVKKSGVSFISKGDYNNTSWEMKHYIYNDSTTAGGNIGFAFKTKLI